MPDSRPLRAVVVDDERLARRELRALLEAHPEVEVVAEAADADAAEAALAGLEADVLFLDVQMPERTGFDLLEGLAAAGRPVPDVVFVTAYDEHALRAFRVSAVDYLLKPVDPAALAEAVGRVAARAAERAGLEAPPTGRLGADDRVFVKDGDRVFLLRVGDVRRFESVGNYTQLHFRAPGGRAERALVLRSLSGLEARLDPGVVVRASRADLVGLAHVVGVDEASSGGLRAHLDDGQTVEFSRRRAQDLRDRLSL